MLKNAFKVKVSSATEDLGEFDSFTGGEYDAAETKYTPYDGVQRTYLAFPTVGNITVGRNYEEARDGGFVARKASLQGTAVTCVVLDRDVNGNYQQNRPAEKALIKGITPPEGDSNANDQAMLMIELSVGTPGV